MARSNAMACAAIASPRPMASTPSFVLPLMLTRPASMPRGAGPPRPGRRARAPRGREIGLRGDLHVRRIAGHDVHGVARALGERRLVCGVRTDAARRDGVLEDMTAESLRRLREKDRLARQ